MQIHKHGFIKGGMCEKRMNQRSARSLGSWMAWNDIKESKKFVQVKNGWYQVLKMPVSRGIGTKYYGSGDAEIGYLRMLQDVFPKLVRNKKKFRLKWMHRWIEGIASCEFGVSMDNPLSIIDPGEKCNFGLCPPRGSDDVIYEKMYGVPVGLFKD